MTTEQTSPATGDNTPGDQVLGAIAGLVFVICALVWMTLMLWFTLAGR